MNALFKLVLSSILAKRVKFFYLHPRLGGGAQCGYRHELGVTVIRLRGRLRGTA